MDFLNLEQWGIRIKEEPGISDVTLENEANENNFEESESWMCKFPCDADASIRTAIPNNRTPQPQEPVERTTPGYVGEDFEYLYLGECSTLENNNLISDPVIETARTCGKGNSATNSSELLNSQEENIISCSQEILKNNDISEKEQNSNFDSALWTDLTHIHSRNSAACIDNISKSICLPDETICYTLSKVTAGLDNLVELSESSNADMQLERAETLPPSKNVCSSGRLDTYIDKEEFICLSKEISTISKTSGLQSQNNMIEKNTISLGNLDVSSSEFPDCGQFIKRNNEFMVHMKPHPQLKSDSDSTKCKQCKKEFFDRKDLHLHKKISKCSRKRSVIVSCVKDVDDQCVSGSSVILKNCNAGIGQNTSKNLRNEKSSHNTKVVWKKTVKQKQLLSCKEKTSKENSQINVEKRNLTFSNVQKINSSSIVNQNFEDNGDVDDTESWSSEICRERKSEEGSNSGTLSLRLFRFRRPKVVLKRTHSSVCENKVLESMNSVVQETFSDHFSGNNNQLERGAICVNGLKERNPTQSMESYISRENSECCEGDLNVNHSDFLELSQKYKQTQCLQKSFQSEACKKITDTEKSDIEKNNKFKSANEQYRRSCEIESCSAVNSVTSELLNNSGTTSRSTDAYKKLFPEFNKQESAQSDLRIRIKPVVVLDRLTLSEKKLKDKLNKSFKENTNMFETSVLEKSCDTSLSKNCNSDFMFQNSVSNNELQSENISNIVVEGSEVCNNHQIYEQFTCFRKNNSNEGKESLEALEKQYNLKKCYVKLTRISDEKLASLIQIGCELKKSNIVSEVKKCGKLKLRRTSSRMWAVTSPDSDVENLCTASNTKQYMEASNSKERLVADNWGHNFAFDVSPSQTVISSQKYGEHMKGLKRKYEDVHKASVPSSLSSGTKHKTIDRQKIVSRKNYQLKRCQEEAVDQEELARPWRADHNIGYKCPNCSAKFHFWMEMQSHFAGCSLVSLLNCEKLHSV